MKMGCTKFYSIRCAIFEHIVGEKSEGVCVEGGGGGKGSGRERGNAITSMSACHRELWNIIIHAACKYHQCGWARFRTTVLQHQALKSTNQTYTSNRDKEMDLHTHWQLLSSWKPTERDIPSYSCGDDTVAVKRMSQLGLRNSYQNLTRFCSVSSNVGNEGGLHLSESQSFSSVILCFRLSISSKAPSTPTLSSRRSSIFKH